MLSHHDLKEEKCWSCDYFCGYRQKQSAPFVGDYIDASDYGPCCNPSSLNNKKRVKQSDICNQYRQWVVVQDLFKKQTRRQIEKQIKKQQTQEQKQKEFEDSIAPYRDEPLFSSISFPKIPEEEEKRIDRKIEEYEDKIKTCKKACLATILISPIVFFFLFVIITWFSLTAGVYAGIVMLIIYGIEFLFVLIVCITRVKYLRYRIRNTR